MGLSFLFKVFAILIGFTVFGSVNKSFGRSVRQGPMSDCHQGKKKTSWLSKGLAWKERMSIFVEGWYNKF